MDRNQLITRARALLGAAQGCADNNQHEHYHAQLNSLIDLLLEELIGSPPNPPPPHPAKFNPEKVLVDVANAVRHRPIAITGRWKIIYYHTRICCVPVTCAVPDKIVLNTFTERMAREGFSAVYWHQTKMNVIALYKELES